MGVGVFETPPSCPLYILGTIGWGASVREGRWTGLGIGCEVLIDSSWFNNLLMLEKITNMNKHIGFWSLHLYSLTSFLFPYRLLACLLSACISSKSLLKLKAFNTRYGLKFASKGSTSDRSKPLVTCGLFWFYLFIVGGFVRTFSTSRYCLASHPYIRKTA